MNSSDVGTAHALAAKNSASTGAITSGRHLVGLALQGAALYVRKGVRNRIP